METAKTRSLVRVTCHIPRGHFVTPNFLRSARILEGHTIRIGIGIAILILPSIAEPPRLPQRKVRQYTRVNRLPESDTALGHAALHQLASNTIIDWVKAPASVRRFLKELHPNYAFD